MKKLFVLTFIVSQALFAANQEMDKLLPLIVELAKTNATFSQMLGEKVTLDAEKAISVFRVNEEKIEASKNVVNAIEDSGELYVPICSKGKCPLLATVSKKTDGSYDLISVGMEQTAADLQSNHTFQNFSNVANGKETVLVEYNRAHAAFLSIGQDALVPVTTSHTNRLAKIIDPAGKKFGATNGLPNNINLLRLVQKSLSK